jgi:hypothetical protein
MASFKTVAESGWRDARAVAVHEGKVYVVSGHTLYTLDHRDGSYAQVGDGSWESQCLLSAGGRLLSLEGKGSLYAIGADGGYAALPESWQKVTAACSMGGAVYVCNGGTVYRIDPADGAYREVSPESWKSILLAPLDGRLLSVESGGSLYLLDPEAGTYGQPDDPGAWHNATLAVARGGKAYLFVTGAWYEVDPKSGAYQSVTGDDSWKTRLAVPDPDGRGLLCFEQGGDVLLLEL